MTPVDCFETKASFVENETFEFRIFADASLLFDFFYNFHDSALFPFFNQVNFAFEKLLMHKRKKRSANKWPFHFLFLSSLGLFQKY